MSAPLLVLASSSPRRRELLAGAGYRFCLVTPEVDERPRPGEPAETYAPRIAAEKADWAAARLATPPAGAVVVGADTVVVLGGDILGKPADAGQARAMLGRLAGREHRVLTAVCVRTAGPGGDRRRAFTETSRVVFRAVTPEAIAAYVAGGEPMDKAGAYAVQGGAAAMIERVEGSYRNVVGLPVERLAAVLEEFGVAPERHRPAASR